jgi:hypothetical protein
VFADAVEALAGVKPETVRAGAASLLRPLVSLAVAGAETEVGRRLLADPAAAHEHTERDRRIARKRALVAARDRARREKAAARRRRWAPKRRQARIIRLKSVVRRLLR